MGGINMEEMREQIVEEIKESLNIGDLDTFREVFLSYHPYDLSLVFQILNQEERNHIYNSLSPAELAPIFVYIEVEDVAVYFEEMNSIYISQMLEAMDVDDSVDILSHINERNMIASYLSIMKKENAYHIRKLLQYEAKTAGSIMTTDFIEIPESYEVKQAMKKLIKDATDAETIYTLYVVNQNRQLLGTLSLRELILARAGEMIADIMTNKVVSVEADMDQEDVALIMRNYDLNALPVVDYQNHIIGIITIDDIVDVINEEANEDYDRFAAVPDIDENIEQNPWQNALSRLPWLVLLLVLGMITSNLLNLFEGTISKMVTLTFYLPLIAGMAGNTGTQTLAVTIRRLTVNKLSPQEKTKHIMKEAITGLIIGCVTSLLAFGLVYIIQQDFILAFLVSLSILVSLIVAAVAGSLVPLIMTRLKVDPAVASGPFITTLNDLISMLIYLGLATFILYNIVS
jgi:magnesium transporter